MRPHPILAALALTLGAACGPEPAHHSSTPPHAGGTPAPAATAAASATGTLPGCRLAAPKKSEDACTGDADCGPSAPCHATECVAKAKSKPRTHDTVCTMMLECGTTDVNRCGCFEGRCALIPPP